MSLILRTQPYPPRSENQLELQNWRNSIYRALTEANAIAWARVDKAGSVLGDLGDTALGSPVRGDLIYRNATSQWARLADVAVGSYLRAGGVAADPLWSSVTLPNSTTKGDLLHASAANVYGNLAAVAAGSYLRSAGTGTAPLWSTLILPNSATVNRVVYASATNTWGESANLTFDGTLLTTSKIRVNDAVAAPSTSIGAAVVNFYGTAATNFLGDPNAWLRINVSGTDYKVPLYT